MDTAWNVNFQQLRTYRRQLSKTNHNRWDNCCKCTWKILWFWPTNCLYLLWLAVELSWFRHLHTKWNRNYSCLYIENRDDKQTFYAAHKQQFITARTPCVHYMFGSLLMVTRAGHNPTQDFHFIKKLISNCSVLKRSCLFVLTMISVNLAWFYSMQTWSHIGLTQHHPV